MPSNLIDAPTIRKFLELLHARAAAALVDAPPGVLLLCSLIPDGQMSAQAFCVGDVDAMTQAAIASARAGRNVYVEGRTVTPGLPPEKRGKLDATPAVFAFVVDHDADTNKAGRLINGDASAVVETSSGNSHEWLFLSRALNATAAKAIGTAIRKACGADDCSGVVTGCYRLPGTPNLPDAKKRKRGRTTVPTQLLRITDKVWSVDDLSAAFPSITNPKLKVADTQPTGKPAGALNGGGPTRSTPQKCTVLRLKVARKVTPVMDRSRQFQAAVAAAVHAGVLPDDLEAMMRGNPQGCAGKYLEGGDRLRQEIERSYEKVKQSADNTAVAPDPNADGAVLLEDVHAFLGRFVVYPSNHAHIAHVLWVAHTHLMGSWESTPRIAFLSPEPGSGKTRALEISELLVPRPVQAINVTPAYLFRKVGAEEGLPTILFDEIDTVFGPRAKDNEEVRALLNAGHRRGAVAGRCVAHGTLIVTEELPAFCAVALAGIGHLPDTISSRAVMVRMRRRAPNETICPYRPREHAARGKTLCNRLAAWAAAAVTRVTVPVMPPGVVDRDADVWEPLVTVANLAGGQWPKAACDAAVTLAALGRSEREEESLGVRLLGDMRTVLGNADTKTTVAILDRLHKLEESPWADIRGKPLSDLGLARRLRGYGIKPRLMRFDPDPKTNPARGYRKEDFVDAWVRYLPPSHQEAVTPVTPVTT
jgi:uncharacterized protein DUF3631